MNMNVLIRTNVMRVLCLGIMLGGGMLPAYASSQSTPPPPVIRVVDVQEVMGKSTAVAGILRDLETYRKSYDIEFSKKEKELKKEERALVQQKSIVDTATYRKLVKEFQGKFVAFQKGLKRRQQQLEAAHARAISVVSKRITAIWVDVAKAEGASIIMSRSQMLLFHPEYDVTSDVIKRLNKSLPSVKFPDPKLFGPKTKSVK